MEKEITSGVIAICDDEVVRFSEVPTGTTVFCESPEWPIKFFAKTEKPDHAVLLLPDGCGDLQAFGAVTLLPNTLVHVVREVRKA